MQEDFFSRVLSFRAIILLETIAAKAIFREEYVNDKIRTHKVLHSRKVYVPTLKLRIINNKRKGECF
jgi:hypothetical protein